MNTTARIEIKTPKVQLKLEHVLYLRSLSGDKVSCHIDSDGRARLQILGLIEEKEIEPAEDVKREHKARLKLLRVALDKAYRDENWREVQDIAYKLHIKGPAPCTTKRFALTADGQKLLKDGGVTIAVKNGCGK